MKQGGGLRIGEMERDCLIAYGASSVLWDAMMKRGDSCEAPYCSKCHALGATAQSSIKRSDCRRCHTKLAHVTMPYAFLLLLRELGGMNIHCSVTTKIDSPP